MDKERIKFLDSAKGLAICLMVFAHAIIYMRIFNSLYKFNIQ